MATRQYIGARYVPKFYDYNGSANWRAGIEYENLIIVTRNGNSYTSKKPVPSNIGEPENNPEYWVATGLYNEQVEAYRQLVLALSDRVDDLSAEVTQDISDEATARENADSALGTRITEEATARENADSSLGTRITEEATALTNRINAVSNYSGRKIVFLGDSYNTDLHYNWSKQIINKMGLTIGTDAWTLGIPGGSFGGTTDYAFLTGLQNLRTSMSNSDANSVTDVVIEGCINDAGINDQAAITAGVIACEDYVTNNFPNAKMWIALVGWGYVYSYTRTGAITAYNTIKAACRRSAIMDKGYTVLCTPYMLEPDMVHPNQTGATRIADEILRFINGGANNEYTFPELKATFSGLVVKGRITPSGLHIYQKEYAGIVPASPVDLVNAPTVAISDAVTLENNQLFMRDTWVWGSAVLVRHETADIFYNVPAIFRFHLETGDTPSWRMYMGLRGIVSGQNAFQCTGVVRIYPSFDAVIPFTDT